MRRGHVLFASIAAPLVAVAIIIALAPTHVEVGNARLEISKLDGLRIMMSQLR